MDTSLLWSIYGLSHQSAFFDIIGVFFAEYVPYISAFIMVIILIWPSENREKNRIIIIISVIAGLIARFVIKAIVVFSYARPRPFVILSSVNPLTTTLSWENLQSFPSGHAIFFFAIAAVIYCFNKKIGIWSFAVATLISIARIYVGVHWPSDIIVGAILGVLTGWLTFRGYSRFSERIDKQITNVFSFFNF